MGPSFRAGATGMGQGIQVVSSHSHSSAGSAALPTSRRADLGLWRKMRRNQTTLGHTLEAGTTLVSSVLLQSSVTSFPKIRAMVGRKESHSLRAACDLRRDFEETWTSVHVSVCTCMCLTCLCV